MRNRMMMMTRVPTPIYIRSSIAFPALEEDA